MKETLILPSIRRHQWVTCSVLALGCIVCAILVGFSNYNRIELAINQRAWESKRPAAYYVVVGEHQSNGSWQWAATVQGDRSIATKLLSSHEFVPGAKSVFTPSTLTLDKIFELGWQQAGDVLDSGLEFDPQYHYVREITYIDSFAVTVVQFTPCGASPDSCPSVEEPPLR